jgi:phosphoribosylformylglycinamidine cyclo-ligase
VTGEERTYDAAGVSLATAGAVVERLRAAVESTGAESFGAFAALHPLDERRLLAASTDSIGTKPMVARPRGLLRNCGADMAAHCINDVITCGAEPLVLLDYVAAARIELEQVAELIEGAAKVCRTAGVALIGGETAEMPGMYSAGDYDLAGFCVGAVERAKVLTGGDIRPGDIIFGLASSGVHSNGFSLVRRIIEQQGWDLAQNFPSLGQSLGVALLEPTTIYVRQLLPLVQEGQINGLAHITGGGLLENIPRVLPEGCHAAIDVGRWEQPAIFKLLQQGGRIAPEEMARTFNCGIGMAVIVEAGLADDVASALGSTIEIGRVESGPRGCTVSGSAGSWNSPEDWSATHNA